MNIASYIITLLSICQSKKFIPVGFPTGGDLNDASMSTAFEIDIDEFNTTITIYTHEPVWFGIGFGGVTMATVNYAVIYSGDHPSETIVDQQIIDGNQGNELANDLWKLELYDTSGVTSNQPAIIQFSRANDVSNVCPQCYTFDPLAETLQVILAKGTSSTYGYHGNGLNKRGETITAQADTDFPTDLPTFQPTLMPTKEPTAVPTFEDCVYAEDIIDGVTLKIQRDYQNQRVGITMEADYTGTDPWIAIGFGNREMNGTYAIAVVGGDQGTDVQERRLGMSGTYDAPGYVLNTDSIYQDSINNGQRIVTVIRDYTVDGSYDFDRFIDCKRPLPTIPVIAATGTTATYNLDGTISDPNGQDAAIFGYHGANRIIGSITNMCCETPSTTWFDMSTTLNNEASTTQILETTGECENGEKYTIVDDCGDVCAEAGCSEEDTDEDGIICTVDPCGCKAICDDSMGFMIMMDNKLISVLMVITGWLLL